MIRTAKVVTAVLLAFTFSVMARNYSLSVQKGGAEIVRSETGEQIIVIDTATVTPKDMISLTEGQLATVSVEKNAMVLIKGPASLSLSELGNTLTIGLDDGQVLLSRIQPYEFSTVTITAKGYSFLPMGTVAAVKTTFDAKPTTAVIEGKVRMQTPSGEALVVEEGSFGSIDSEGKLTTGPLSPRAIESLNEWLATAPVKAAQTEPSNAASVAPSPEPATAAPQQPAPSPEPAAETTYPGSML